MVVAASPNPPFVRGDRNRHLLPHRFLQPMREHLLASAELLRAAATFADDDRWRDAAAALDDAAEALRKLAR